MVVAALLEPKFCAQAWWFSHMPGSKCAFRRDETAVFASAPRTWRVAAPLASSGRFLPFSKTKKTLGPFAQQVLRPPADAPRGPTCSFYCVLQLKLALRPPKLERERHFSERFPRGLLGLFWPHTWPLGPLGCLDLQLRKTIVFYGSN